MLKKKNFRGFTLVELLIVMAVIGILASIILVALGGSEEKARDTRVKVDLNQLRNMAGIIRVDDRNYDNMLCTVTEYPCTCINTEIKKLCDDVGVQGGELIIKLSNEPAGALYYAAYSKLNMEKGGSTVYFCVDSRGMAKETTTEPVGVTQCP